MTAFGKILVFMNLLFSVVTGFMIIMVFDKRTDWKAKYDKMERRAESAEVAFRNEKQSHENDLKQKDSATTSKETEIASLKERLVAAQADAQANLKKAQEQEKIKPPPAPTRKRSNPKWLRFAKNGNGSSTRNKPFGHRSSTFKKKSTINVKSM